MDTSTPAVVLKLDRNVFHHGGLGVIRTLGRLGVPVHAVHEDVLSPAAVSRYLAGRWRWNPDPGQPERIHAGLVRLAERIGRPAVLLPTDDAGAIFLAEYADELRRWFLFASPDRGLPRRVADKSVLAELCRATPVSCPETILPASLDEATAFVDRVGLPVFAKLARPWRPTGRLPRSTVELSTLDCVAALYRSTGPVAGQVLLQEAVRGGPDWFFHGYCDATSTCRPSFTGVKERAYPYRAGLTTLGRAVDNERLRADVQRLLQEVRYRGPVDLDLRWDVRQERYRLLDFNPRIGAQFRLFEDAGGLDVARAAYFDLTGQPVPDRAVAGQRGGEDPAPARRFIVENYDLLAALAGLRRGELGLRGWLRSLRRVDETAWFARDDLAPFGLMCLRFGWRLVERPVRRRTRRPDPRPPQYRPGRAVRRHRAAGDQHHAAVVPRSAA